MAGGRRRGGRGGRGGKRKRKSTRDDCDFREQQRAKLRATLDRRVTEALHELMDTLQRRPTVPEASRALDEYKFPPLPLTFYARMDEARRAHAVSVTTEKYVADIVGKAWAAWERRQTTCSAATRPATQASARPKADPNPSRDAGTRRVLATGLLTALKAAESARLGARAGV